MGMTLPSNESGLPIVTVDFVADQLIKFSTLSDEEAAAEAEKIVAEKDWPRLHALTTRGDFE